MSEVTETGIDGLDAILDGGLATHSTTLIDGGPGTGKSVFGLQFIYHGAAERDERGMYLSFSEDAGDLQDAAVSLGLNRWPELVERGDITVYDKRDLLREHDLSGAIDLLLEDLEGSDYARLVLDPLSLFHSFFDTERERRTYLLKFSDILTDHGMTAVFLTGRQTLLPDTDVGPGAYLTDGYIRVMQVPTADGVARYAWVVKMRSRDIEPGLFPMELGGEGLTIGEQAVDLSTIPVAFR